MVKLRKTSNQTGKNRAECQKLRGFDFRHCVKPQNNNKSTESRLLEYPGYFLYENLFPDDKEWGDN